MELKNRSSVDLKIVMVQLNGMNLLDWRQDAQMGVWSLKIHTYRCFKVYEKKKAKRENELGRSWLRFYGFAREDIKRIFWQKVRN
jgi:hypothetical protein